MNSFTNLLKALDGEEIFRFVPFNSFALQTLINRKLYFGDPHFQNDPIDSNYNLDIKNFRHRYKYRFGGITAEETALRTIKNTIDNILKKDYGICCFSKKIKEILLWSHYSEGSQGFCMLFDKSKLMNSLITLNETMYIDSVNYYGLSLILPEWIENKVVFDVKSIIYSKMKIWKYESEIRIMCELTKQQDKPVNLYEFDQASLNGIIAGERMRQENILTIKNILKTPGYEHVSLFKVHRRPKKPDSLIFNSLSNK
jgi:hypothetical protein